MTSDIRAFPGAQGWGATAVGGRGGRVIEVTTLADAIPAPAGSFRAAVQASGPRTVVFRVGGIINLADRRLPITEPYLTIAGQTAPGGGILITGKTGIVIQTHDFIIRYLRGRLDGTGLAGGGQINIYLQDGADHGIIDHCSVSWAFDENLAIWKFDEDGLNISDITIQRCLIAEGLAGHGHGLLMGGQDSLYASDIIPAIPSNAYLGVRRISIHHNLFAHNYDRNPRLSTAGTHVINNVVYNWGSHVGVSCRQNTVDFINNYWKPGPMSGSIYIMHERLNEVLGFTYPDPSIYTAGNIVKGIFEDALADNRPLFVKARTTADPTHGPLPDSYFRATPLAQGPFPITIHSARDAYALVSLDVGANARLDSQGRRLGNPDAVDRRIMMDVRNGTGWIDLGVTSPAAAGGFPTIAAGTPVVDSDHDGIPDDFESAYPSKTLEDYLG